MKKLLKFIFHRLAILSFLFLFALTITVSAQKALIHSHNDYQRHVPFYQAYSQQVYSIEADIFAFEGKPLLVGHSLSDLSDDMTLERMYIRPIVNIFENNAGRAWYNSDNIFQLLIDLKTPVEPTLNRLIDLVKKYPEVFDPETNPLAVRVVITGFVPAPGNFSEYPGYIFFDGLPHSDYTPDQLNRVALISLPLHKYTSWKGEGVLPPQDKNNIQVEIDRAHAMGKMIRFWGAPDNELAWTTLSVMGADIINTDKVERCTEFFGNK